MATDFDIPEFRPGGGAASATGNGTSNKASESTSYTDVGAGFGLTGNYQPGLRSPDAIDRPSNVLQVTTSANVSALPPEQLAMLQAQLLRGGFMPSTYSPTGTLDDDTRKGLLELKRTSQATGMSDLDTLNTVINTRAQAAAGAYGSDLASGGAAVDNSPSVQVNKTITEPVFTDPITARGILMDTLQARLGRAPTSEDYDQFKRLLQSSESGQDVTTVRQTTRPGKTDNDSRTTQRVTHSDDTTDPSASDLAEDMSRRGRLGREANTVQAASVFDVIARRVGGV